MLKRIGCEHDYCLYFHEYGLLRKQLRNNFIMIIYRNMSLKLSKFHRHRLGLTVASLALISAIVGGLYKIWYLHEFEVNLNVDPCTYIDIFNIVIRIK